METTTSIPFRVPGKLWATLALAAALTLVAFWEPIVILVGSWLNRPEYSHGIVIPVLSAYLLYQRRDQLASVPFTGSWLGALLTAAACAIWFAGTLSTIFAVTQFALVVAIAGTGLSLVGARQFRYIAVPVLMLFFMVPLPAFLHNNFSATAQLISSELGVAILRLFGVSVFLEGNVIDLGHFQMQVVEACDGLRYLFPIMTLGLVIAYFSRIKLWQKVVVFASTVPITIGMNSSRIAMIGLFAENGNTALARGVLHDVHGWAMFMISTALIIFEVWLFVRFSNPGIGWRNAFNLGPAQTPATGNGEFSDRKVPAPLAASVTMLAAIAVVALVLPTRAEARPEREICVTFPMSFPSCKGNRRPLERQFEEALAGMNDYVLADYSCAGEAPVNLWLAYYESQRSGAAAHSPRSCLPGGGWRVESLTQATLAGGPEAAEVNRAVISRGNRRQLVYYWFKQRDRWLTSEYAVKWYILVDSLTKNRSDGALVRLVTPVPEGEPIEAADERLSEFAEHVQQQLPRYVPD